MHLSYLIVDDFLPDPETVRAAALQLDYPEPDDKPFYPGRNSSEALRVDGLVERMSLLAREPLKAHSGRTNGACRIALEGDSGRIGVHVDRALWSAIIYLSRDEDVCGGTNFYRHRRSGLERAPVFKTDLEQVGLRHPKEMWDALYWPDAHNPEAWEKRFTIPMRFNRLVLFKSYLWHDAGPGFVDCLENGRLIWTHFYVSAADHGEHAAGLF